MIRLKQFVIGSYVIRDQEVNSVSVINIMDAIAAPTYPLFFPSFGVLVTLERDEGDPESVQSILTMRAPDGQELFRYPFQVSFRDKKLHRQTIRIEGLILPLPGMYLLTASVDDHELGTFKLYAESTAKPNLVGEAN